MRKQRKAFTLVEALVVLAIIGILMAILLPAIQVIRRKYDETKSIEQSPNYPYKVQVIEAEGQRFGVVTCVNRSGFEVVRLDERKAERE